MTKEREKQLLDLIEQQQKTIAGLMEALNTALKDRPVGAPPISYPPLMPQPWRNPYEMPTWTTPRITD